MKLNEGKKNESNLLGVDLGLENLYDKSSNDKTIRRQETSTNHKCPKVVKNKYAIAN